jgi:hypothetical protein
MKSRWIRHNNKRVFIADFSNMGSDSIALRAEADAIKAALTPEPPGSVRAITCVDGTFGNAEILQILAELLPVTNKVVGLRALVGVSGFRKYFLETFTKLVGDVHFKQFDDQDKALDWITEN